jgi:1,4-dihydroxy-2-naphthoyl-CoA hydrolase
MVTVAAMRDREHFAAVEAALGQAGAEMLPGHLGIDVVELGPRKSLMRCSISDFHRAPNGYLHAGSVVSLADTAAGYGCVANFPEGATGFTTIELKVNFLATLTDGSMLAEGTMVHGGRTTQLWDVEVRAEDSGKTLALFRCTQLILYPRT